jgi:hypothetical protein
MANAVKGGSDNKAASQKRLSIISLFLFTARLGGKCRTIQKKQYVITLQ